VAPSFAGSQRDYVGQVAQALQSRGVRCFYDADEQIELRRRLSCVGECQLNRGIADPD
jgi:hypothetical protein